MNVEESRQQSEQRSTSTSAVEAPWKFVRDPDKLQLCSLRFHRAPVVLYTLSLRSKRFRCDSTTTTLQLRSWRCICVFSVFMQLSWRLNYVMPIICQHSKHFITQFAFMLPLKSRRANYIQGPGQEATFTQSGPQERYANSRSQDFYSRSLYSRPLHNAEQTLLRMNSMEKKKALVHDCHVYHSHWNYDIIYLVRWLVVNLC